MEATTMLSEKTIEQLRKMKLGTIADEYDRQMNDPEARALPFDDRFGMMVDLEYARRENDRLAKLIARAGFTDRNACVENIAYLPERNLKVAEIQQLASCAYIERNVNVRLLGPTGSGKTFLANALGVSACRKGYSVKYTNLQDMLVVLALARESGEFNKAFEAYKRAQLLIVDDWLMFDIIDDTEASILYNLIEAHKYSGSIIVCSQLDVKGWHGRISNKVAADSICDRLAHGPHEIIVDGEMRKLTAEKAFSAEAGIASV
jgi:DNA replication protein DnaC